jgi:hypothetical protein
MLWALLAYYFFGGFGGATALGHFYNDQAKSLIKAEVKDSRRRDNAQVFAGMVKTRPSSSFPSPCRVEALGAEIPILLMHLQSLPSHPVN